MGSPPFDVWVHEFGRTSTRLTTNPGTDDFATWSADGNRIVFSSLRKADYYNLYQKSADGAGNEELLFQSNEDKFAQDSSRDGRYLLFSTGSRIETGNYDLWMLPLTPGNGAAKPEPYLKTPFSESQGRFSPDSRFVAYRSNASGKHEIYVQPFPDPSGRQWTISMGGGIAPRWRRDGKELFYISADSKMMAVEVTTTPVFTARAPKVLFQVPIRDGAAATNRIRYDVTADGKRFLIDTEQTPADALPIVPITVIVNWPALLKK